MMIMTMTMQMMEDEVKQKELWIFYWKNNGNFDVLVVVVGEGEVVVPGEHPGQPVEEGKEEQHERSHSLWLLRSDFFCSSVVFLI